MYFEIHFFFLPPPSLLLGEAALLPVCVLKCIFQRRLDMSFILRRGPSMEANGVVG